MRPVTVITGIFLGSCLAIIVSLAAVLIIFLVLNYDYPRLQHEFRPLSISLLIFFGMTIISAASFYALLINHRSRWLGQLLMWIGVAATSWYYMP